MKDEGYKFENDKLAVVILHYMDMETTINCIKSFRAIEQDVSYSFVIVDNASPNNTGRRLLELYKEEHDTYVILLEKNLGYAKGNNAGYNFAKNVCKANFIIIVNNDVIFNESWKFCNIRKIYNGTQACIIGPDILSLDGTHQSPLRIRTLKDKRKIKRLIRNMKIYIFYFELKKRCIFFNKISILEKILLRADRKYTMSKEWEVEKVGAVLHGACMLVTPGFIQSKEEVFDPRTFMYGEEDLLALKAEKKGYTMLYTPDLNICHLEGQSTQKAYAEIDKRIFQYKNKIYGCRLLLEELNDF